MEDNKEWVYYSELVPGYLEKWSNHEIRRRNERFLKKLKKGPDEEACKKIKQDLIENNLPLARYIADYVYLKNKSHLLTVEDAYQNCCIALTRYIYAMPCDEIPTKGHFQIDIYFRMLGALNSQLGRKEPEMQFEKVAFNENDYPVDDTAECINRQALLDILQVFCSQRDMEIMQCYWFGDPKNYIEPFDSERISDTYNLCRASISRINVSTLKKLRKHLPRLLKKKQLTMDFFYEEKRFLKTKQLPFPTEHKSVKEDFLEWARQNKR